MILNILKGISIVCSLMLCLFVAFFQTSKANGLTAITGEGLSLFTKTKVRGAEKTVQNIVTFFTISLFVCIVLIPLLTKLGVK